VRYEENWKKEMYSFLNCSSSNSLKGYSYFTLAGEEGTYLLEVTAARKKDQESSSEGPFLSFPLRNGASSRCSSLRRRGDPLRVREKRNKRARSCLAWKRRSSSIERKENFVRGEVPYPRRLREGSGLDFASPYSKGMESFLKKNVPRGSTLLYKIRM